MPLTPVFEGDRLAAKLQLMPGAVWMSSDTQKIVGLEVETATRGTSSARMRTTGLVIPDENRLFRIVAAGDGWIRPANGLNVGADIRKGTLLGTFSGQDVLPTVQSYLVARASLDRARTITKAGNPTDEQLQSAEDTLRTRELQLRALGMGDAQLSQLAHTGKSKSEVELVSPADGIILARNVQAEQACERGMELFRIAGIETVWIEASLFNDERKLIAHGAKADVTSPYFRGALPATADRAAPFVTNSQTLPFLLHAANPRHFLRPGMQVDLSVEMGGHAGISVPSRAVLNNGSKSLIYIQTSGEVFEPRSIETGETYGDRVVVTRGLGPGEKVVTSGTFLLDSANRMQTNLQ